MPIRFEHVELVRTTPERAFALIDDLPRTAEWLPPCVSLEKLGDGPNSPGDRLRYVFKQGGSPQEMSGEILERVAGRRLCCKYTDVQFDVLVDLEVKPATGGAATTHIIEITPKSRVGKLFSPLIRLGLKRQTRTAASNLKRILEAEPT